MNPDFIGFTVFLVLSVGLSGFLFPHYGLGTADDTDCRVNSSVDERGPGCHEICVDKPLWFYLGTGGKECYWDDAPEAT